LKLQEQGGNNQAALSSDFEGESKIFSYLRIEANNIIKVRTVLAWAVSPSAFSDSIW
jgi:hypothetical protein